MIKIEIIDPCKENPDVLVRLAGFLMECAGHKMVKAPEEPVVLTVDELPGVRGHGEIHTPYQHCGESDLTTYAPIDPMGNEEFKKITGITDEEIENNSKPIIPTFETVEIKKPKSRKKTSGAISTPPAPIPPLEVEDGTMASIVHTDFPSGTAVKHDGKWVDLDKLEVVVNGNTLIDKILKATTDGALTHADITEIVKKHGLSATKEIFTNDHLVPAINASIDEALRGK